MNRARKLALLTAGILCLALAGLAGLAGAATGTPFTSVGTLPNGPIGVAVSPSQLIVSEWCKPQLDSISDTGVVAPYASIPPFAPNPGICVELYLAFSPGQNGWAPGDLYVTQDNLIYKVGPGGAPVTLFATIPAAQCDSPDRTVHSGITFDTVGTFGNDMIVTCVEGSVWRINTAGTPSLVVDTAAFLEGPSVVPAGFGPKGGQIFVGNEALDTVLAISNTGVVSSVVGFKLPEDVEVIPPNPCNFGNSGGSMFGAMYDAGAGVHDVWKWAAADLTAAGPGNLLVTSEGNGGTGLITVSGGVYSVSPFSSETTPHEGADILNCAAPPPPSFCPLTQGYWKNHASAWPVSSLTLGSQTYTKAELLAILNTPVKGDASIDLAHQLIAAKLNIAAGADSTPIAATITDADALLGGFAGKLPYNVKPSSAIGQKMVADASKLDQFNQRQLTPSCPAES